MTMKGESRTRTKIVEALRAFGASAHVYHATPYGETGHPDVYGTYRGRAYFFEVKPRDWDAAKQDAKTRERFKRQVIWLMAEQGEGAVCAVVRTPDGAVEILKERVDKGLDIGMDNVYIEPVIP